MSSPSAPGAVRDREAPDRATWQHGALAARLAIVAPTVLALALTAWRYDTKPLWRDEVYTLTTAGRDLPDMFELLFVRDAGLSVYYTLMHGWLLVSHDPAWMRLPGAVAAVAAVALTAALGRRIGGSGVALLAGTAVALSQALVVHAQEARPYPLVLATVVATTLLALRAAEGPSRGRWVALSVVGALAVGLHPLVALPAIAGTLAALWLRPGRASRRQVFRAAAPAAVLGVLLVLVGAAQAIASPPARMPLWKLGTFWKLFADVPAPGLVFVALAVVGAVVLHRRRRRRELVVLGAWAVLPLVSVSVLGLIGGYFNSRYATAAVPALAVLAAVGACATVAAGVARLRPGAHGGARAVAVSVLVLAAVVSMGPSALAYREKPYSFDDAPAAAAQLAAQDRPGDAVVFVGAVTRPLVERYLPPGELVSGSLHDALLAPGNAEADTLGGQDVPAVQQQAALAGFSRVWVVGTTAVASGDLSRRSTVTRAAMDGRTMLSRTDHGHVRVELWAAPQR